MRHFIGSLFCPCLFVAATLWLVAVQADGALQTYLLNIPAPDGNGQFSSVGAPTLSESGQVAFTATLSNTSGGGSSSDRFGVFRMETSGAVTQIARGLQTAPGGTQTFGLMFAVVPLISGDGDVAFTASREGATGTAGIYRGAPLTKIVERLETAPDGNGRVGLMSLGGINEAGQVAFHSTFSGMTLPGGNEGIFRGDGNSLVQIARWGDPTPVDSGTFTRLGTPKINESGQVAFFAQTTASASAGIYRGAGGAITPIARQGEPAPAWGGGTNGTYSTLTSDLSFNDAGEALFSCKVNGVSGMNSGVFRGNGVNSALIFAPGMGAPTGSGGTSGTLAGFQPLSMNNDGEVITVATLAGTPGGTADNRGIFVSDGESIRQVMRNGDPAPDGNGTFAITSSPTALVLNDAGQTVFQAILTGATPGTENGIYFHDPAFGLKTVARTGQTILGQTVTDLSIVEGVPFQSPSQMERSGLNELGQVAFRFTVDGGAQGLAIWSAWSPADFNKDGDVDGDDLATWQAHIGQSPATLADGDCNGDNVVDGVDFLMWQRQATVASAGAANAVPEPSAALLAILAASYVLRRRIA